MTSRARLVTIQRMRRGAEIEYSLPFRISDYFAFDTITLNKGAEAVLPHGATVLGIRPAACHLQLAPERPR